MKLLKELFSFDEEENDEFAPAGGDDEFNFDFDFENPELDQDLDFNADGMGDGMEVEGEPDYGAEEDYPEGMMDMPTDEYVEDGEGGLEDLGVGVLIDRLGGIGERQGRRGGRGDDGGLRGGCRCGGRRGCIRAGIDCGVVLTSEQRKDRDHGSTSTISVSWSSQCFSSA